MRKYAFLLVALFALNTLLAQTSVKITFNHTANGEALELGQTEFRIWNNKKTKIDRAEFYLSEIELVKTDGSTVPLTDYYILANAANPDAEWEAGSYDVQEVKKIRFGVGVDAAKNHLDPSTYPSDHPLANQNPSMHWGWQAGYRFMAIEGWVDRDNSGDLEAIYQFHNLDDKLYRIVELDCDLMAENGELIIPITLDYAKLFQDIPMEGNVIQHGSDASNEQMMNNTVAIGFFGLPSTSNTSYILFENATYVFPNPIADGQATVDYVFPTSGGKLSMTVVNTLGQQVFKQENLGKEGRVTFDVTAWEAGVHQILFSEGNKMILQKTLVVE